MFCVVTLQRYRACSDQNKSQTRWPLMEIGCKQLIQYPQMSHDYYFVAHVVNIYKYWSTSGHRKMTPFEVKLFASAVEPLSLPWRQLDQAKLCVCVC